MIVFWGHFDLVTCFQLLIPEKCDLCPFMNCLSVTLSCAITLTFVAVLQEKKTERGHL